MIFYGTSSSRVKEGQMNNVICPNCNNQTSMSYAIFVKYFYLYWIPIFPTGKANVAECNSCDKTYKVNQLPDAIKKKFEFEKQGVGTPIKFFSGLFIIAALIATAIYFSNKNEEEDAAFSKDPQVGDVYSTKGDVNGYYSTMKVTDVTQDSVYVIYNDYEVDKRSGTNSIDKAENYTINGDWFSKGEIEALYVNETIYEIDRD